MNKLGPIRLSTKFAIKVVSCTTGFLIAQDVLKKYLVYKDFINAILKEKDELLFKMTSDGVNRFAYNLGRAS